MRILHTSDLHGRTIALLRMLEREDWDLWVDSGDFFPNFLEDGGCVPHEEPGVQRAHMDEHRAAILSRVAGRPLVSVAGNHDFVSLTGLLGHGHDLTQGPAVINGVRFSGFREIPFMRGEWQGETNDFEASIERMLSEDPEIIVTHAPPCGILDHRGYGIRQLTSALSYRPHNIRAHFFGHAHSHGRQTVTEMGITFRNGAEGAGILEV